MKKFVLVVFCAFILLIFIAFNYLLWDKGNRDRDIENLKYINVSSNTRISEYEREIKNLEDEITQLKANLGDVNNANKRLEDSKIQLEKDKAKYNEAIVQKNEVINILKQSADIKSLEVPISQWAESIDKSEYTAAYELQSEQMNSQYGNLSLTDFVNKYKGVIKSINVKSIKLCIDKVPYDKKCDIIFSVSLEVNLVEGMIDSENEFKDGLNNRYFFMNFDTKNSIWVISSISSTI